ncbi:MAG: tryptophan synthase subunit alpha [Phycisphaerales bacterium]
MASTSPSAPHAAAGNRVLAAFAQVRAQGRRALLPFVTAGYPNLAATEALLPRLARAGGSIIEVGIPFSDPIADGPVTAESMHEALVAGCTPAKVFESVRRVRAQVPAALVAMVSDSIVDRMGTEAFTRAAAEAGFDGLIVPDIDLADAPRLRAACDAAGLACTLLVAPTSGPERVQRIVAECTGFVYALARVGITGERSGTPDVAPIVQRIRAATTLPVAVGFGLSSAEQVRAVLQHADGAIVGSAIVRTMRDAIAAGADPVAEAEALVQRLAAP